MFERAKPRGQISARELRAAGQVLDQARAGLVTGGSLSPVATPGGTVWADDLGGEFLAKITHVVTGSPGDPIKYGFSEQWQIPGTGALEAVPSGRLSDGTKNWALAIPSTAEFAVDDLVMVRRHRRNPNLYEVVSAVSGAIVEDTFQFPLTYTGTIDPETCEVTLTVATWQTVTVRAAGLEIEVS